MKTDNNDIAISGAGIGGLTLAIALRRLGVDFSIYDKADTFEPIGYGIQITPNAVRVLHALGLADELAAIGNICERIAIRNLKDDKPLLSWNIGSDVPYYQCLRSDLHRLLYQQLSTKVAINYSSSITSINDVEQNCLVASDGVHSQIRRNLYPKQQAQFSGYVAYRAVVPFEACFTELKNQTTVWLSEDQHIVVYPVGRDNVINIALVAKQKEVVGDSWVQAVDNDEILQRFKSSNGLINDLLLHLKNQNPQSYCWGLFDYKPLPGWYADKQVLLGDAAHPMLPFMAQGAAMAIEDAWVLAESLAKEYDFQTACLHYQSMRYQRASKVQKLSRKNAAAFHASGLVKYGRNTVFKLIQTIQPQLMNYKTRFLYDYDVTKC